MPKLLKIIKKNCLKKLFKLLKSLRNEKYTHLLKTMFGILILICKHWIKIPNTAFKRCVSKFNKVTRFFYHALFIYIVIMHGLLLSKTKNVLQLIMLFKKLR